MPRGSRHQRRRRRAGVVLHWPSDLDNKQEAQAIAAWRDLVRLYPSGAYFTRAYFQIAFALPYPQDVDTFEAFAAAAPNAPEAPDALYRAARLSESNNDFSRPRPCGTASRRSIPQADQAADAAMQAGLAFYRNGDLSSAALRFELASTLGSDPDEHARALAVDGQGESRARRRGRRAPGLS